MNERLPTDQPARDHIRAARDVTMFVEAGAGSGKTRALVDRVEALVLHDRVPLEQIAAITFTEKAAAELRDRIRQRFEATVGAPTDEDTATVAAAALRQLDGAAIGTLHSFAQRILGEHPVEAGLPPGLEVLDEIGSEVAFEQDWRAFLDDFLDDHTMASTLLTLEAVGVRLDDLRTLGLRMAANWDLVEDRLDLSAPPPGTFSRDTVLAAIDRVERYVDACATDDDALLRRFPDLRDNRASLDNAIDDIDALSFAVTMGNGSRATRAIKVGNVGRKTNWRVDIAEVRDAFDDLRDTIDHAVETVTTAALAHVASRIGRFVLEAAEQRRVSGRLEFHDLLVRARRLLRDPENGREVRAALAARYPRLLLDEFQDTDPIQIELATLIASDQADVTDTPWTELEPRPGSLFLVGDPKQSIYRFRRADIGVFLAARDQIDDRPSLTVNFRTTAPIIRWVNDVFDRLITFDPGGQPEYVALSAHRDDAAPTGPSVALLGADPIADKASASELRTAEANDVAGTVANALFGTDRWSVADETAQDGWRPARANDVCILLPTRTSVDALERALEEAGVPYRTETSSLVYASREVRALLLALAAVADPTDELSTVAALRSFVYGCGDDDLADWRLTRRGRFSLWATLPDTTDPHPVADGLRHLRHLHDARFWSSPAELLDRLVRERGVLESAVASGTPRDVWRRLRFVIDQARAWVDAGGTDLRAYLQWARLQGADGARVSETVLPETDDESVRIMTIHGSKGLEFPITVLAGMTSTRNQSTRGPTISFPPTGPPAIRLNKDVTTPGHDSWQARDERLDQHERIRLLYVAATRARDHLVVCLHRDRRTTPTGAALLAEPGLASPAGTPFAPRGRPRRRPTSTTATPLPPRAEWIRELDDALGTASRRDVIAATTLAREAAEATDPGLAKRVRDLDLPPWQKGRYGTAVGRAVHGVLQVVDLATGDGLEAAAAAQAAAEGIHQRTGVVTRLARRALSTAVVAEALEDRHWREVWVAAPLGDQMIEGYVDLLYRTSDGLVIVDWKTDHLADSADLEQKLERYRLQGAAYAAAVEAATGESVARLVFVFLGEDAAVEAALPALPAAVAEVRRRTADLASLSAAVEAVAEFD